MKRIGWFVALLLVAIPAWSAKKITVAELKDMLMSMHQANKSDADVAAALKQVQLSEMLDRNMMNDVAQYVPGQSSTEQIYVFEARSAMLPPPASEIPTAQAPDAAAQKAILDKAENYATKIYAQLPAVTSTKATRRFQDNVEAVAPSSGTHGSATDASNSSVSAFQFVHFINSTSTAVVSDHGIEKPPAEKDKTAWGANKMIAIQEPDPSLSRIFQEAKDSASTKWLRWQSIDGKQTAVFTFDVPKKKSHFNVSICCFPNFNQTGLARTTSDSPSQDDTVWRNYKAVVPYHGEFFIDPESGTMVRMITEAELKPTEIVRQQDTRTDYGLVTLGDKTLVLPLKTVVNTEVVPNGDPGAGRFSTRFTSLTSEFANYQLTGAAK